MFRPSSSHASYPPFSSLLVLVHALLDCPPAFSCRRRLVLVVPLAFAFESPSVLVRSFALSFSSFPLALVLLVLPPHLTLLLPLLSAIVSPPYAAPDVPIRTYPGRSSLFWSGFHVRIRLSFFSFSSRFPPLALSPPASRLLSFLSSPFRSLLLFLFPSPCRSAAVFFSLFVAPDIPFPGRFVPGCSSPGAVRPRMFQSAAPGAPPDDPVRGLVPCFIPPRTLQSGASFYRILSVASDAPVRGTGFTPGRSSPGASAVLHSAPDAPIRGVFLSYSLRCLGRSSPWHRVHPRTIQSRS